MNGNACKAKCEWHYDCDTAGCVTRKYVKQRIKPEMLRRAFSMQIRSRGEEERETATVYAHGTVTRELCRAWGVT